MPDRDQTESTIRKTAEAARNKVADVVEGNDTVAGFCHDVEQYVSQRPLKALAIAFLAGMVVARVIL